MSLAAALRSRAGRRDGLAQLAVAVTATALVAGTATMLVLLLLPAAPAPVGRNPFGVGVREVSPSLSGLGGLILSYQGVFNRALETAMVRLKAEGGAPWALVGLGLGYGIFHAAGPGHGKGIIAAYLVSNERALARGFAVGLAAAMLQGAVAIAIVAVMAMLLRATAPVVMHVTEAVETSSFVIVALLGALLVWRKSGRLLRMVRGTRGRPQDERGRDGGAADCGHVHMPGPDILVRSSSRELAGVIVAAGIRPCSGAILILVFGLSQGLFAAGIAAVLAMSIGTALTTGAIAALAVFAKRTALRIAGGAGGFGEVVAAGLELAMAAMVLVLGVSLVAGSSVGLIAG